MSTESSAPLSSTAIAAAIARSERDLGISEMASRSERGGGRHLGGVPPADGPAANGREAHSARGVQGGPGRAACIPLGGTGAASGREPHAVAWRSTPRPDVAHSDASAFASPLVPPTTAHSRSRSHTLASYSPLLPDLEASSLGDATYPAPPSPSGPLPPPSALSSSTTGRAGRALLPDRGLRWSSVLGRWLVVGSQQPGAGIYGTGANSAAPTSSHRVPLSEGSAPLRRWDPARWPLASAAAEAAACGAATAVRAERSLPGTSRHVSTSEEPPLGIWTSSDATLRDQLTLPIERSEREALLLSELHEPWHGAWTPSDYAATPSRSAVPVLPSAFLPASVYLEEYAAEHGASGHRTPRPSPPAPRSPPIRTGFRAGRNRVPAHGPESLSSTYGLI